MSFWIGPACKKIAMLISNLFKMITNIEKLGFPGVFPCFSPNGFPLTQSQSEKAVFLCTCSGDHCARWTLWWPNMAPWMPWMPGFLKMGWQWVVETSVFWCCSTVALKGSANTEVCPFSKYLDSKYRMQNGQAFRLKLFEVCFLHYLWSDRRRNFSYEGSWDSNRHRLNLMPMSERIWRWP